jgi:hypothetical protein
MNFKREISLTDDIVGILTAQLTDTLCLGADVQHAEAHIGDRQTDALELLRGISRELWAITEFIERRASECGRKGRGLINVPIKSILCDDDGGLGSLLSRFCIYVRNTSDRLVIASELNDRETVLLLDRILSIANKSIWFLDIYSNAIWLKCRLSLLPKWSPAVAVQKVAS